MNRQLKMYIFRYLDILKQIQTVEKSFVALRMSKVLAVFGELTP